MPDGVVSVGGKLPAFALRFCHGRSQPATAQQAESQNGKPGLVAQWIERVFPKRKNGRPNLPSFSGQIGH
jgi:hypothetical protein